MSGGPKAGRNVKGCCVWTEEHEGERKKGDWGDKQGPDDAGCRTTIRICKFIINAVKRFQDER